MTSSRRSSRRRASGRVTEPTGGTPAGSSPPGSLVGETLAARYRLLSLVGSGGMGQVYLAEDMAADCRTVAVKTLKDPQTVDWFKREFATVSLMAHPNIARVHDFAHASDRDLWFQTCEYVDGKPAHDALAGKTFEEKLPVLVQILRALQYIHSQGYLHCDIKPHNVLVRTDRKLGLQAKVLDFGLAVTAPQSSLGARGTLAYMAPEWFEARVPGTWTDLYSAGIMFYELAYGRLPFVASSMQSCMDFHVRGTMTFPDDPAVPDWFPRLLLRMTSREVADRLQSIRECLAEMNRLGHLELPLHDTESGTGDQGIGGAWLGRKDALDQALAHTEREPVGHHPMLLVVESPAGVGKSRLLSEVRRRAQLQGRPLVALAASPSGASVFSALSAAVDAVVGPAAAGERERVSHMVARLTTRVLEYASRKPLLFLVDDIHSLDEHSRSFFRGLANAVEYARENQEKVPGVTVLATRDPGPGGDLGFPRGAMAALDLPPLNRADSERLVRLILGASELPADLLDEAWSAAAGNPKLLTEFTLFLRRSGCIAVSLVGVTFDRSRMPKEGMPGSVEQYLLSAWKAFSPDHRALLSVLSVASVPLPFSVLAEASGLTVWQVDQIVGELSERGLTTFRDTGEREYPVIESETVRGLFAGAPGTDPLPETHRRIALAVASQRTGVPARQDALAYHWFKAGQPARALPHALRAAERQRLQCNFARAVELADIARECGAALTDVAEEYAEIYKLWGRYDEGVQALAAIREAGKDEETRGRLALFMAELHFRGGKYKEAQALLEPHQDAADASLRGPVLALLSRVAFFSGGHDDSRRTGEKGMLLLPHDSRPFAMCAAMVGLVRVYEGKLSQGAKYLETALLVLRRNGSPTEVAFAENAVGLAHHKLKNYSKAEEHYQNSLDIARAAGDLDRINTSTMNLSVVAQETGDYAKAIARYREALANAYQSQNVVVLAKVYNNLGNIHRYLGLLQKAEEFTQRSVEVARSTGGLSMQGLNDMLMGEILTYGGRYPEAQERLESAQRSFAGKGSADERIECDIDRVELLCFMERLDEAVELGRQAAAQAEQHKLSNHKLRALLATADALTRRNGQGDAATALGLLEEAEDLVGTSPGELEWRCCCYLVLAHHARADRERAALAMKRCDAALRELRRRVPEQFRQAFFSRPDRRRLVGEIANLSSRIEQLADTMLPGTVLGAAAARKQQWMSQLIAVNKRLLSEFEVEKLLETLIDVVVDLSEAERGFVLLASRSGLDVVVARNMDREAVRRSKSKFSTSIASRVLQTGEVIRLEDAIEADDFRQQESIVALRIRSVICLPLKGRSEVIGAMYLDNRFKPGVFSQDVVEMLQAFAEQATVAIETTRLLADYKASVAALEQARLEVERLNSKLQEKVLFQEALLQQKAQEIERQQEQLQTRFRFSSIIGASKAIQDMFSLMARIVSTHVPVLILGESGVGKELVARAIHFEGQRKDHRFVSINCAALPDTLLESELFGHRKGAFTDASTEKKGLFALADCGTLFLDEVGDMSLSMQAKLLRVLQEGEFSPLGAEEVVKVDVRIVAATNRDLRQMVASGQFRQDLYYRLDVVSLRVPPLRQRMEDVPLLLDHFLNEYAARNNTQRPAVSPEALRVLMAYDWPGNVRELQSVVQTSAVFAQNGVVTLVSLQPKPEVFRKSPDAHLPLASLENLDLRTLEKQAVAAALARSGGNKQQAARLLGISRRALYNKLEADR